MCVCCVCVCCVVCVCVCVCVCVDQRNAKRTISFENVHPPPPLLWGGWLPLPRHVPQSRARARERERVCTCTYMYTQCVKTLVQKACACARVCVHAGASARHGSEQASEAADRGPNTSHSATTIQTSSRAQGRQEAPTIAYKSGQPKRDDSENNEAVILPVLFLFILFLILLLLCMYVCMCTCLYACVYVCMHACMYACMYVCPCLYRACLFVCIYVCTYVCTCMC